MPRKNPLPEIESAIAARLLGFRKSRGLSRVVFARQLGIDSTTLANVEHQRTPLRYAAAREMCRKFNISPRWLATGKGSRNFVTRIDPKIEASILPGLLFSEAYREHLAEVIEADLSATAAVLGTAADDIPASIKLLSQEDRDEEFALMMFFEEWASQRLILLPKNRQKEFLDNLLAAGERVFRNLKLRATKPPVKADKHKALRTPKK